MGNLIIYDMLKPLLELKEDIKSMSKENSTSEGAEK